MISKMGEPRIKIVAMPGDTNAEGNIFGGWILSQVDLAGGVAARELAPERVVTKSMKKVIFKEPVFIGDVITCYASVIEVGNTSITTKVEVVAQRLTHDNSVICVPVTSAHVIYVSVDKMGNKKIIEPELKTRRGFN